MVDKLNKFTMTPDEFVTILKTVVLKSAVDSTKELLRDPPGRSPSEKLKEMSAWYSKLAPEDRTVVDEIINESATSAVFGFLCVLDGVRAIEDGKDKGTLKLFYEGKDNSILVNDRTQFGLHELL